MSLKIVTIYCKFSIITQTELTTSTRKKKTSHLNLILIKIIPTQQKFYEVKNFKKQAHIGDSFGCISTICSIFIIFNDILGSFSTCFIFFHLQIKMFSS